MAVPPPSVEPPTAPRGTPPAGGAAEGPPPVAVVLAAGLGTRFRADGDVPLSTEARRAADAGLKALVPLAGRPLLEHLLARLAAAGVREAVIVTRPDAVAAVAAVPAGPVGVRTVVQDPPLGTAHAVSLAAATVPGRDVVVVNGDDLYPVSALRALVEADGPALVGFPLAVLRRGTVTAERARSFAVVDADDAGRLVGLVEKPGPEVAITDETLLSMNCWRLDGRVLRACAEVPVSARGERELPLAVALAVREGVVFHVVPGTEPVLGVTARADVAAVEAALAESG